MNICSFKNPRFVFAILALSCNHVIADEKKPWVVSAELGAVSATGNTEDSSFQAKLDVQQHLTRFTNSYVLTGLMSKSEVDNDDGTKNEAKTAEKFFGSFKSAYDFSRKEDYLFSLVTHTDDKFGAYRRYSTASIGYGSRLIDQPQIQLNAEVGPGYVWEEKVYVDPILPDRFVTQESAMLRIAGVFNWQITANAEFVQTLSVENSSDNRRTLSETSLATKISDVMQMKAALAISNDSDTAPDKKNTDTVTSVTLVYKF